MATVANAKHEQTANDVLDDIAIDHKKQNIPVNQHTTDGIYATLDYMQAQIQGLADYIDGKRTKVEVTLPAVSTKATAGLDEPNPHQPLVSDEIQDPMLRSPQQRQRANA